MGSMSGPSAGSIATAIHNQSVPVSGTLESGDTQRISASPDGHLEVAVRDPSSAYDEVRGVNLKPRVQIDAYYGLLTESDHEVRAESGGTVTASGSMFVLNSGTSSGGLAQVRSRRLLRARSGQGVTSRFSALFDSTNAVADSAQYWGPITATEGVFVGYSGATFGATRRIAGAQAIRKLTVSAGASGAESLSIVVNGAAPVVVAVASGSAAQNAAKIATATFTGWVVQSVGAVIVFRQVDPAADVGAFTFTNTTGGGTCAATWAQTLAGAPNDDDTEFVAQADWNRDVLDGSGSLANPSGMLLAPGLLNMWQITVPDSTGTMLVQVYEPTQRHFTTVHEFRHANTSATPSQLRPIYRLGGRSQSTGASGTEIVIKATELAGFVEGDVNNFRAPYSATGALAADATETHILSIRLGLEFNGLVNQREAFIESLSLSIESTANRAGDLFIYRNATLAGSVQWQSLTGSASSMHYATGASITGFTANTPPMVTVKATQAAPGVRELFGRDIRMSPGDVFTMTVKMVSAAATASGTISWRED